MHPLLGSLFVASAALTQSPATQPAPTATRLVWGDFDSDGRPDLFIPDAHAAGRLLRNRGDGGFDDVTSAAGLASRSPARVAAWIDVDDDGRLDLLLGGAEGLQLMRGDGASFRDVTTQAGLEGGLGVRSFAWIDFDADGSDDLELACEEGVRLYRGLGQGVFAPVDLGLPPPQARGVVTVGPWEERPPPPSR